jgi:competence protein ComEA
VSQPHDPYRHLDPTRADPPPARAAARPIGPDPKFWGDPRERRHRPRRPPLGGALDRFRDAVATWRADARVGLALLVAVAVLAGVVWYRVGTGGAAASGRSAPSRAGSTASTRPRAQTAAEPTPTTRGKRVVVHVAGAVARPGVVELAVGSRVIDAVEAAGGGLPEADLDRLNLAAKLADGQRVLVQKVGDPPVADVPGAAAPGGPGRAPGSPSGLVNLNTATLDQLDQLPGIGPTLAAAILAERDRRGGFRSVNELRDVRGIGEKRFADLRDLVSV